MIIEAGRIFRCAHSYVAVKDGGIMVFACLTCGYRTELLPMRLQEEAPRVIAFPAALTGGSDQRNGHQNRAIVNFRETR